jgi:hypothetical protein
MGMFYWVLT